MLFFFLLSLQTLTIIPHSQTITYKMSCNWKKKWNKNIYTTCNFHVFLIFFFEIELFIVFNDNKKEIEIRLKNLITSFVSPSDKLCPSVNSDIHCPLWLVDEEKWQICKKRLWSVINQIRFNHSETKIFIT